MSISGRVKVQTKIYGLTKRLCIILSTNICIFVFFLLTFVISVLRPMTYDYHFGIFKRFLVLFTRIGILLLVYLYIVLIVVLTCYDLGLFLMFCLELSY